MVNDTLTPAPVLMLARAMGSHFGDYRDALAKLALDLERRGAVKTPMEPVTREMLYELYDELEGRGVAPDRGIFDAASPWIARSLGYEMTRVTFGADAEFQRRAREDAAIQRAARVLAGSRAPREVFARIDMAGTQDVVPVSPLDPEVDK